MNAHMPITIGDNAVKEFIQFCKAQKHEKFLLVADKNTFRAPGRGAGDRGMIRQLRSSCANV